MCGIAGFVKKRKTTLVEYSNLAKSMVDAIKWRGPDGQDVRSWEANDKVVSFAHCRLSILDLSENGRQPMESSDGSYSITYNGEIYNYIEIRQELKMLGYRFQSTCDTEVLLKACIEWGIEEAVKKCNGMFAFAFYDREQGKVFLCRDRMGVKPLYYSLQNDEIIFSSDLRALMADSDYEKVIDRRIVYGYLWNMFIPAPFTIFKDTYKLESGTYLEYDVGNAKSEVYRYWDLRDFVDSREYSENYEDYTSNLKILLQDAVKLRLEADVPVGVFLSGGIDSSLVSALSQESSSRIIHTYSIGFAEKLNDDASFAREVSKILGTEHTELFCTAKDALGVIEDIPKAFSEPFSDNSLIPTMVLSKLTREHVTVALSGDAGDELFFGYPHYLTQNKLYGTRALSRIWNKTGGAFVRQHYSLYDHRRWVSDKFSNAVSAENILLLDYITAMNLLDTIIPLQGEDALGGNQTIGNGLFDTKGIYNVDDIGNSFLSRTLIQSIKVGLQDDMLVKVDRTSMYYSLETRCPMLDYRVVEMALGAPIEFKYRNGNLKAPLRDILSQYIPESIINRPKMGFGMPVNEWIHCEWKDAVNDYLNDSFISKQGIFNSAGVRIILKEFNKSFNPAIDRIVFSMLILQLWWNCYF